MQNIKFICINKSNLNQGGLLVLNKFESYYADKFEFKNLDLSLSRIDNALKEAGFNEKSLGRIIHIAGTNGKGSTSYFYTKCCSYLDIKLPFLHLRIF